MNEFVARPVIFVLWFIPSMKGQDNPNIRSPSFVYHFSTKERKTVHCSIKDRPVSESVSERCEDGVLGRNCLSKSINFRKGRGCFYRPKNRPDVWLPIVNLDTSSVFLRDLWFTTFLGTINSLVLRITSKGYFVRFSPTVKSEVLLQVEGVIVYIETM